MVVRQISVGAPGAGMGASAGAAAGPADFDTVWKQPLDGDKNYFFSRNIYVSPEKPITQPYWLAEPMAPGSFNVNDQRLIGDPQSAPAYEVRFTMTVDGQDMVFTRP